MNRNGTNGNRIEPILDPLRRTVETLKEKGWIESPASREEAIAKAVAVKMEAVEQRFDEQEKRHTDDMARIGKAIAETLQMANRVLEKASQPNHIHVPENIRLEGAEIAPHHIHVDMNPLAVAVKASQDGTTSALLDMAKAMAVRMDIQQKYQIQLFDDMVGRFEKSVASAVENAVRNQPQPLIKVDSADLAAALLKLVEQLKNTKAPIVESKVIVEPTPFENHFHAPDPKPRKITFERTGMMEDGPVIGGEIK